ncbi:MAG: glycosyltransferase [Planctomycetaceae bacterium]|nr:glycosyltransferase [Planctomycetaceae bacterium]
MSSSQREISENPLTNDCLGVEAPQPKQGLRIGLVISELAVGGAEKNFVNLACGLKRRGHDVFVFSLDPRPQPPQHRLVDLLEKSEVPLTFFARSWTGLPSPTQIAGLRRTFKTQSLDLIASFLFRANLAAFAAASGLKVDCEGRRHPLPVVLGFRQAEPRKLVSSVEKWCLRRSRVTVCVSHQVAKHYVPSGKFETPSQLSPNRNGQVVVIPNGISRPDSFGPIPNDLRQLFGTESLANDPLRLPILLFVGRLTAQKGVAELLELAPMMLARLPSHRLVFLGDGPLAAGLQARSRSFDCRDRIHFLGWQPNPMDYIRVCELLLLNSRWEGQPNAILEAMSAGKPFVSTDTHGISDIFQAGGTTADVAGTGSEPEDPGTALARRLQVVPSCQPSQYADAVVSLALQPDLAKIIGKWNQNHVERYFSVNQFVSNHEQVFLKLAGRCQHRP